MPHDGQTQGPRGWPNILGVLRATNLRLVGKAGATAGAGLAGGTTSGAPTSGQFDVGEAVIGQDGSLWICSVAGSPGTFLKAGGTTSPLTTKGDTWGYSTTDARVPVGSNDYVLTADSTQSLGVKWAAAGAASLTTAGTTLGSDVNLPTSNTWVDILSVSLAAGTWLVLARAHFYSAAAQTNWNIRITTGTTHYASDGMTVGGNTAPTLATFEVLTLGATTTIKLQAVADAASVNTNVKAATVTNGSGNNATSLLALKVA